MLAIYIISGIFVLLILLVIIAPNSYRVERSITIDKPRNEVFDYLKYLKNQDEWSPWARKDPNMHKEYHGTDGEPGFVSAWEGNKDVGKGEQELKSIRENERINSELRFLKPWRSTSDAFIITEDQGPGKTRVRWGFEGKNPAPFNIIMLFMDFDKAVGKDFEEGLQNLKLRLEN